MNNTKGVLTAKRQQRWINVIEAAVTLGNCVTYNGDGTPRCPLAHILASEGINGNSWNALTDGWFAEALGLSPEYNDPLRLLTSAVDRQQTVTRIREVALWHVRRLPTEHAP